MLNNLLHGQVDVVPTYDSTALGSTLGSTLGIRARLKIRRPSLSSSDFSGDFLDAIQKISSREPPQSGHVWPARTREAQPARSLQYSGRAIIQPRMKPIQWHPCHHQRTANRSLTRTSFDRVHPIPTGYIPTGRFAVSLLPGKETLTHPQSWLLPIYASRRDPSKVGQRCAVVARFARIASEESPVGNTCYSRTGNPVAHIDSPVAHIANPVAHIATPVAHIATPVAHIATPMAPPDSSGAHMPARTCI